MSFGMYSKSAMPIWSISDWQKDRQELKGVEHIYSILDKHKALDFVQRIYDPSERIKMPGTGRSGTHYMVYGETDGKYAVYPRIVRKEEGLELLDETAAWNHAKKTGELIFFDTRKEAEWFSYHYKDIWKGKFQPDGKSKRSHSKIE